MDKHSIACFFFIASHGNGVKTTKEEIASIWSYEDIQFLRNCGLIEDVTSEYSVDDINGKVNYIVLTPKGMKFNTAMEQVTKLMFL